MKELPNKWCIKIKASSSTTGKKHDVIKYLNKTYNKTHDGTAYYYGVFNNDSFYICSSDVHDKNNLKNKNSIPEISFEDFQRLVLGINVEKVYELW